MITEEIRDNFYDLELNDNDFDLSGVRNLETVAIVYVLDSLEFLVESCTWTVMLTDHKTLYMASPINPGSQTQLGLKTDHFPKYSILFQTG